MVLAEGWKGDIHGVQQPAQRGCVPGLKTILNHLQCHWINLKACTYRLWADASSFASLAAGRDQSGPYSLATR
jgi:hypothetical protein